MEGWLVIVHLWMFYLSSVHVFGAGEEGRRMWHRWLNVAVVVAVIVSIYGYGQLLGIFPTHQGSRVDASLGNAAYMAVYMLMNTGIVAYLFFVARARQIANAGFLQWLYAILTVLFGFLVIATATRGTAIGLVLGFLVVLISYAVFSTGMNAKKIIAALSYPVILALYVLFTLILHYANFSLWFVIVVSAIYFIALIAYVFVSKNNVSDKTVQKWRWVGVGTMALMILIIVGFYSIKDAKFIQDNEVLRRMASISVSDTSSQARQYIWPMAINGALQRPILGWGQENFNYIFNKDYNPLMWRQEQWFDRAHNVYLDWMVASGTVGLLAYLSLYVLFLAAVWKSSLTVAEKSVLTGLLAGYSLHNIFVFDNLASYVFFFVLLGFVGSLTRSNPQTQKTSKATTWLEQKTFSTDAVEYIVMPIVIVVLALGFYFLDVRPIQANTRLITALSACSSQSGGANPDLFTQALSVSPIADQEIREQILSCAGNVIGNQYPVQTKQAFFELASKAIKDQIAAAPKDARMYVIGGMFLNNVNQTAQALPILEKAHELTPEKQSVEIQLATVYINIGNIDEAVSLLKHAYEADPTYDEAKSAYITGLILAKKDAEAHKLFDPSPVFESERVARAYASLKEYDKSIAILKKLVAADPKNVNLIAELAQVYYTADKITLAVETLRTITKDHPELQEQVEAGVKQIQAPKK